MTENGSNSIIIMLGSNAGDRRANLDLAMHALRDCVSIDAVTADLDNPDITGAGADYLNRLVFGRTALSATALDTALKDIETCLGRDRTTPRTVIIDIDTVIYAGIIVRPKEYASLPFRTLIATAHAM
ncbi:MAG: 2-amino-4-hydroxy-6-hydroxymethyldihydropteridine diphosphokinase [Muribaculaceae bacterium]|nr:2-amino-4-hydroxy-6-hydroxymethyldihydropteridine diphosphokinase [Muribaculaceae bacterium]